MNNDFLKILLNWPRSYIFGADLSHILSKSVDSRYSIVKRAVQKGYLIPLRRDLYFIENSKNLIDTFEFSSIIYGPSYVSFESALSYHGWIPEAVRTTTCASPKKMKIFETVSGIYSYEHIPTKAFSFGVKQYQQPNSTVFIATPLKAIADMIYARNRIWDSLEDLSEDLRIEPENFQNIDKQLLRDLIKNYPSLRVKNALKIFINE